MSTVCGRLLFINLTERTFSNEEFPIDMQREYLGGSMLATRMMLDMQAYEYEPFDPENPLIIMTGPLAGTAFPGSQEYTITTRSPLTSGLFSTPAHGSFARLVKSCGWDGIVITGASETPVGITFQNGEPSLEDATQHWGKGCRALYAELLAGKSQSSYSLLSIGPAGENLVRFATICEGDYSAAPRGGAGAVLGAKKVKYISAFSDTRPPTPADSGAFITTLEKIRKSYASSDIASIYKKYGTAAMTQVSALVSETPVANWRHADWEHGADRLNGVLIADTILKSSYGCDSCSASCRQKVAIPDGPFKMPEAEGPDYNVMVSLGYMNMMADPEAVTAIYSDCIDNGLDPVSAGAVAAATREFVEAGIVAPEDVPDNFIKWGDYKSTAEFFDLISRRKKFGSAAAEGIARLADNLAQAEILDVAERAVHVKGLELLPHDPRAYHGLALIYTTSQNDPSTAVELMLIAEKGFARYKSFDIDGDYNPISKDSKAGLAVACEDLAFLIDSACICPHAMPALSVKDHIIPALTHATGINWSLKRLRRITRRAWYEARIFNNLCGMSRVDDEMPPRAVSQFITGSPTGLDEVIAGAISVGVKKSTIARGISTSSMTRFFPVQKQFLKSLSTISPMKRLNDYKILSKQTPDTEYMIREYYTLRELDKSGHPRPRVLAELELDDFTELIKEKS